MIESVFNHMDAVAKVGGPRLGITERESRVKGLCSNVLAQRPTESTSSGVTKQYHHTKSHLQQVAELVTANAEMYTPAVLVEASAVPKRPAPDVAQAHRTAAARANPAMRAPYKAAEEAKTLVFSRTGKYCQ